MFSPLTRLFGRHAEDNEPAHERAEPKLRPGPTSMITRLAVPDAEPENEPPPEPRNRLAAMLDKRPAKPAKTPAAKAQAAKPAPEQISLPLVEGGWRFPPLSLLKPAARPRAPSAPPTEALRGRTPACWKRCWRITACRAASSRSAPARW